jgi:NADPH-dependent 7-cyano-7-deazaguanine reductase QueF
MSENPLAVPCSVVTDVEVTLPLRHLCPYADEADEGTVEIRWTSGTDDAPPLTRTIELHALAAYLDTFATRRLSHEEVTAAIQRRLEELRGLTVQPVVTRWVTAGAEVVVRAVPGQRLRREGS